MTVTLIKYQAGKHFPAPFRYIGLELYQGKSSIKRNILSVYQLLQLLQILVLFSFTKKITLRNILLWFVTILLVIILLFDLRLMVFFSSFVSFVEFLTTYWVIDID